jgi:hypothetical protein
MKKTKQRHESTIHERASQKHINREHKQDETPTWDQPESGTRREEDVDEGENI